MIGVLTGHWLRSEKTRIEKVAGMFVAGAVCIALGWAWNSFFPINKALWTSSYVLVYRRSGFAVFGFLLLADRHQGLPPLGQAV